MFAVAALSRVPLAMARANAAYPTKRVAALVVEKLDLTSLPSAYRPKKEKGNKTLADYGYTVWKIEEKEVVREAPGARRFSITILQQGPSGIYACFADLAQDSGEAKTQSVILLKHKESTALLKGRESWKEFTSCPVIGGSSDHNPTTNLD